MASVLSAGVRGRIQEALVDGVRRLGVEGEIPDLELGRAKVKSEKLAAPAEKNSKVGIDLGAVGIDRSRRSQMADRAVEIGLICAGTETGRTDDDQLTVIDLTGVGVQDVAAANAVLANVAPEAGEWIGL